MAWRAAARVPGQVLVSRTVTDLTFGSEIDYTPAGPHELKGIPGTWDILTVVDG